MRAINNLSDAQLVLNSHENFINNFNAKSIDRRGLKLVNNGDATDPQDYVTLKQLPSLISTPQPQQDQHYTAVFTQDGIINTGDIIPAFIAGYERTGTPVAVKIFARQAPSGGNATINIYVGADGVSGQNILANDLILPNGSLAVASSSDFIPALPYVGMNFVVYPVITNGASAAIVTIELILKRTKNA